VSIRGANENDEDANQGLKEGSPIVIDDEDEDSSSPKPDSSPTSEACLGTPFIVKKRPHPSSAIP
jgi:hypothetical protein